MATKRPRGENNNDIQDGSQFIVKNLMAEELLLTVGTSMRTFKDLRAAVLGRWKTPSYLQSFTGGGRSWSRAVPDNESLDQVVRQITPSGRDYVPILWLLWHNDDQFVVVFPRGPYSLSGEDVDRKARHWETLNRTFECVRTRVWREIAQSAIALYDIASRSGDGEYRFLEEDESDNV